MCQFTSLLTEHFDYYYDDAMIAFSKYQSVRISYPRAAALWAALSEGATFLYTF